MGSEIDRIMQLDWLEDPETDQRLLPGSMRTRDNSRRLSHQRRAVVWAMGYLKPEQREHLRLFYGGGLTKREIARRRNVTDSAVLKSLRAGEDKLRGYASLYMEVYDRLERELLSEREDGA